MTNRNQTDNALVYFPDQNADSHVMGVVKAPHGPAIGDLHIAPGVCRGVEGQCFGGCGITELPCAVKIHGVGGKGFEDLL